ncbi:MAG: hypothetical protein K2N54_08985 [Helicobacter sp.]|nr:hypothetical protein [Helicobacter sp.]
MRYACICHAPQRCVYVMPCGSNIDVARCGWDYLESVSNGKFCHCERAARAWQSTGKESQHIEHSKTVDCREAKASRNDKSQNRH